MLTALISAMAVIIASVGTILLTKQKERDAIWRAKKLAYYEEFFAACSGIVGTAPTEAQIRFANSVNNLHLIGSRSVINSLHLYLSEIAESNPDRSKKRHDMLWSGLVWQIRADLGDPPTEEQKSFQAILWSPGTSRNSTSMGNA